MIPRWLFREVLVPVDGELSPAYQVRGWAVPLWAAWCALADGSRRALGRR